MEAMELMRMRHSVRQYQDKPIPDEISAIRKENSISRSFMMSPIALTPAWHIMDGLKIAGITLP